jgi:hypothetical protein
VVPGPVVQVRTDPRRLARSYVGQLVLQAVVLVLILGYGVLLVVAGAEAFNVAVFAVLLVAQVLGLAETARQWLRWRRTPVPLQLDQVGMVVDDGRTRVAAPWAAVAQVRFTTFFATDVIRVRFAGGYGDARVQRRGMTLVARNLDTPRAEVARMVVQLSAGRVQVTP